MADKPWYEQEREKRQAENVRRIERPMPADTTLVGENGLKITDIKARYELERKRAREYWAKQKGDSVSTK